MKQHLYQVAASIVSFFLLTSFTSLLAEPTRFSRAREAHTSEPPASTVLRPLQLQQDIKISLHSILYNISSLNSYYVRPNFPEYSFIPWEGYSLQAKEIIDSAQSLGIRLLHEGHDLLGLTQVSRWQGRLLYWLLAGHADTRLQLATSVVFGHEMIHLQEAFANGAVSGTLVAAFTGQPIGLFRAYAGALLSPLVHAVAVSYPSTGLSGYDNLGNALNIPTWISFERAIDLAWKPQSVFGAGGFFANSIHAIGYAGVDTLIPGSLDIQRYAAALSQRSGKFVSSAQIFVVSILPILSSPAFWGYVYGLREYIANGELEVNMPGFSLNDSFISWNVATYYNDNSLSFQPVLLARLNQKLLVGTGLEFGILGQPELDIFFNLRTIIVKNLELSLQLAFSLVSAGKLVEKIGLFIYPFVSYNVGQIFVRNAEFKLKLNTGIMISEGQTLISERLNPYRSISYNLSMSITI